MIARLSRFRPSRDSNLGLIEFARDTLAKLGVKPRLVYDVSRKKANLFCTLADDVEAAKCTGLILSGHTDTVPVDGQEWSSDPFKADHRDGRIHGRGSADMKGFIAIALAYAPKFLAAQQAMPVHLSLTFDEETTFTGVNSLVADWRMQASSPPAASSASRPTCRRSSRTRASAISVAGCAARGAFVIDADGSQRDRVRGADHRVHPLARRQDQRQRVEGRTLRVAAFDAADRRDSRRPRRQRGAARMHVRVRDAQHPCDAAR